MSRERTDHLPQLVRLGAIQGLDQALRDFGCDPAVEFSRVGFRIERLQQGDLMVNIAEVAILLEHCTRVTACPHLPFYLAEQQDISFLGTLGLLLKTAPTVGRFLEELYRYHQVHVQAAHWSFDVSGSCPSANVWIDSPRLSPFQRRLLIELALAQCFRVLDRVSGGRVKLERVTVHYDYPGGFHAYRRFFHVPIEFNAEKNALIMPPGTLDIPVSPGETALHNLLLQQIADTDVRGAGGDLASEVSAIIRSLLPTGRCSIERVAKCYACDKRTLQRYLREECNTTYQDLLDETRFRLVRHYLRESNMPVTQLAQVVGFTDPSNFARAFRKRFGQSPRKWRMTHGNTAALSRPSRYRVAGLPS